MVEKQVSQTQTVDEKGLHLVSPKPIKRDPWWKLGGKDVSFVSVDAGYVRSDNSASSSKTKLGSVESLGHHVFETAESKEIYKPIEGYEGSHRFDPTFEWTAEEEKTLVRTVSGRLSIHIYTI